jgi:hypothetical protein
MKSQSWMDNVAYAPIYAFMAMVFIYLIIPWLVMTCEKWWRSRQNRKEFERKISRRRAEIARIEEADEYLMDRAKHPCEMTLRDYSWEMSMLLDQPHADDYYEELSERAAYRMAYLQHQYDQSIEKENENN